METKSVVFEAIDPLALLLPGPVYLKLIELNYPHVPLAEVIEKAMATLTRTEKQVVLARALQIKEFAVIVEKAAR
jgi:hypothetical protein